MGLFICEKCGKIENTVLGNYWHAHSNKHRLATGEPIDIVYKPEFEYFETHACCAACCTGVTYIDDSGILHDKYPNMIRPHWTDYGKEKLLEWEARHDGSMENATEFFANLEQNDT